MIKLYCFGNSFGLEEPSPFTLKVDLYLRVTNTPFEAIADVNSLRTAPKGKLPFIEDKGKQIADSYFILQYLNASYQHNLDDWMSQQQQALAHLATKSLDENLYWCIVYSRWMADDTWPTIRQAFFGDMPVPLKWIVPIIARKGVKGDLASHGMGRHSEAEIFEIAKHSLQSLADLLADKPYMFGERICSFDVTAYAFLAQLTLVDLDNPLTRLAKTYKNLVEYCQGIHAQYYGKSE